MSVRPRRKVDRFVHIPYRVEHFVLSYDVSEHVAREEKTLTFVTDGIESVLQEAKTAAGDKNVAVGGGASIAQQCIRAGLLDEIQVHLVPVPLGEGIRLFEHQGPSA